MKINTLMTERQIEIIGHSLGIGVNNAKRSKLKKDKKLKKVFFRNYFCASRGHSDFLDLEKLVEMKCMVKDEQLGNIYFFVTDYGRKEFRKNFYKLVNNEN